MQTTVCRGCRRSLLDENSGRNIFADDSIIKSFNDEGSYDKKWCIKLCSAIELITGLKVTKEEKLPHKFCELCFQNVEAYINFRFQLLRSRDILLCSTYQDVRVPAPTDRSTEMENLLLMNTLKFKAGMDEAVEKLPGMSLLQGQLSDSPLTLKTITNSSLMQALSDDLINVDDSSTSLEINSLQNEKFQANHSSTCSFHNDQENNNLNNSDNSFENTITTNVEEINVKKKDHDVESEIDVCSGEEDDVLELDVQKLKNETVEICSSSESDIEVCDYEPTGKKGNYNTFSPPIRF